VINDKGSLWQGSLWQVSVSVSVSVNVKLGSCEGRALSRAPTKTIKVFLDQESPVDPIFLCPIFVTSLFSVFVSESSALRIAQRSRQTGTKSLFV